MASHPEIDLRTAYLDRQFLEQKTTSAAVSPSEEYLKLEKIAKMEILPNFYQSEDYGVESILHYNFFRKMILTTTNPGWARILKKYMMPGKIISSTDIWTG